MKDNTVTGRFRIAEPSPVQPRLSSDPSLVPDGSPSDDGHALFRPNARTDSDPHPTKPPQSPIERKAYAIAEQLQSRHWDNCKVFFAKQTARSYAEDALRDGHDQRAIIEAYDITLRY